LVIDPPVKGNNTIYQGDLEAFIIGRPIRLADVLLAVVKDFAYPYEGVAGDIFASKLCRLWNLKDDNLDNQSEECKQFLINLLVP
jgi:hypothetical protein